MHVSREKAKVSVTVNNAELCKHCDLVKGALLDARQTRQHACHPDLVERICLLLPAVQGICVAAVAHMLVCNPAAKASTGYEGGARTGFTTPDFDKQWYAGQPFLSFHFFHALWGSYTDMRESPLLSLQAQ